MRQETFKIILASNSPRRKELLGGLGIPFEIRVIAGLDETFPADLPTEEVPLFLAKKKAAAYANAIAKDELIITADTVVWLDGELLEKPRDREDAITMLSRLAGNSHRVLTGVSLLTKERQRTFTECTTVHFSPLSRTDIEYYVDNYHPYDKAGSYGIQEWIGYIGVQSIEGCFYNVMGLPTHRLFEELRLFL